jgi:valyl-tRNA synthetase
MLRSHGAGEQMSELQEIVSAVRNVRNLVSLADGVALAATLATLDVDKAHKLDANREFMIDRANLSALTIAANAAKPPQSVTTVVGALKVHIPLSGLVDLGKLKDQLSKREIGVEKSIAGKQARLTNADYIARAPAQQVTDTRELLAKEEIELANLKETLAGL